MKKIKLLLASIMIALGLTSAFVAVPIAAAPIDDACAGLKLADGAASCNKTAANNKFSSVVKDVINILSVVTGAVCVIMVIIGGFRYVISNGDQNGVQGAKNTILYAIIGLVIVFFAQIIVRFVLTTIAT